jgi:hypothetical protein
MTALVFSPSPSGREPFLERWAHRTIVLPTDDDGEQRQAGRTAKALRWSLHVSTLSAEETGWLDALLAQGPALPFAVPYWPGITRLSADAAAGAMLLAADTTDRRFEANQYAMLWRSVRDTELVTTGGITDASVACSALAAAWPAGSLLLPARVGYLDQEPEIDRPTNYAAEVGVAFELQTGPVYGIAGFDAGVPGA